MMENPLITNFAKPLTLEGKQDLLPVRFDDYDYIIAFKVIISDRYNSILPFSTLPPELGTFSAFT